MYLDNESNDIYNEIIGFGQPNSFVLADSTLIQIRIL